jgi:hypothetical protein
MRVLDSTDARIAALSATRQMIAEDQFHTLAAILVDCGAVPRNVMAATLGGLADRWLAKARGELDCEYQIHGAELADRAMELSRRAASLRS